MSESSDEASSTIGAGRGQGAKTSAADWIVDRILSHTSPGDEVCTWIGAAAGFHGNTSEDTVVLFDSALKILRDLDRDVQIFIANDAVSILKAPPLLGSGIAAIVGTGSIVIGVHPLVDGVVRRGGYDWPIGDTGAGVWLTVESARLLFEDLQHVGGYRYHSPLLDRLCDYFRISIPKSVPDGYAAFARAETLAAALSEARDAKRYLAGFVHPDLFELAQAAPGRKHDPIAAQAIARSVSYVCSQIDDASQILAAHTADNPNDRERIKLVISGSIAANALYSQQLLAALAECKYVEPVEIMADGAVRFARLAWHYLHSSARERRLIEKSFDPVHAVHRLI